MYDFLSLSVLPVLCFCLFRDSVSLVLSLYLSSSVPRLYRLSRSMPPSVSLICLTACHSATPASLPAGHSHVHDSNVNVFYHGWKEPEEQVGVALGVSDGEIAGVAIHGLLQAQVLRLDVGKFLGLRSMP